MGMVILLLLLALVLALGWNIVNSTNSQKPAAAAKRKASAGQRGDDRTRRAKKPQGVALDPSSPAADLSYFKEAGEDGQFYLEKQASLGSMSALMDEADLISRNLASRQTILDSFNGSDFDPKKASELVLSDPVLATEVLKTVNSPFYGLSQKIASVFRAIVLLGHVEVRNIIWRSCLAQNKRSNDIRVNTFLNELWQHSFAVSRVAYAIAKDRGLPEPDRISTTALLHDIGKLISLNSNPEEALELYSPIAFSSSRTMAEESRLGVHHAALGSEVTQIWGLPGSTSSVVRLYHAPSYLEPDEIEGNHTEIAIVHIADLLCHNATLQARQTPNAMLYLPRDGWLKTLGMEQLEEVFNRNVIKALPRGVTHPPQPSKVDTRVGSDRTGTEVNAAPDEEKVVALYD